MPVSDDVHGARATHFSLVGPPPNSFAALRLLARTQVPPPRAKNGSPARHAALESSGRRWSVGG